ncbi:MULTISPECIES: YeiH family protein [Actinomyces]|uniref:Putative sulfate exporter family transporter n=1 Tax=Actinomyces respiraculi TaxID=2744574 RepID=A0A7T0LLB9_9ACTO|nr:MULTISPECIES: putative sulfate exporter family transporter [Actinomyces]QPL05458.1 putative sulfate exporter family transporter [Actinomyces respiraculi]
MVSTPSSSSRPALAAGWPGIMLCAAVAAVATAVNTAVPLVSAMLIAILVGLLLRNLGLVPALAESGLKITARTVLRAGVVLLGLRLSVPAVLSLGWGAIGVIVATVTCVYLATLWAGRLLGVPRATTILTATGTAICGAAAVAGMSAVLRADDEEAESVEEAAATAIASVTLFGTVAILVLPLLVSALGLGAVPAGVWVGAGVHEVGQVVAAAGLVSTAALDVAVVAKLGRVVLLAPLVAIVGVLETRRAARLVAQRTAAEEVGQVLRGESVTHRASTPVVPLFVLGFLAAVVLRSLLEGSIPAGVFSGVDVVASFLLTMAMCAMGAGVNLRRLARSGGRALLLGALAGVVGALVPLVGVLVLVA